MTAHRHPPEETQEASAQLRDFDAWRQARRETHMDALRRALDLVDLDDDELDWLRWLEMRGCETIDRFISLVSAQAVAEATRAERELRETLT